MDYEFQEIIFLRIDGSGLFPRTNKYTFFQSESASVHSNAATGTLFRQALWKFDTGARISTLLTDLE